MYRFTYIDPPDRTQGSGLGDGSSMQGVLGLIWQKVSYLTNLLKTILIFNTQTIKIIGI